MTKKILSEWENRQIGNLSHCGTKPRLLRHIKLTENEYCIHPFECLYCGEILEVAHTWDAYHYYTGGTNQYGKRRKSYTERFYFRTIKNHPDVITLSEEYGLARERGDVGDDCFEQLNKQLAVDIRAALGMPKLTERQLGLTKEWR